MQGKISRGIDVYNEGMHYRPCQIAYRQLSDLVVSGKNDETVDTINRCIDAGLQVCGDTFYPESAVLLATLNLAADAPLALEAFEWWIDLLKFCRIRLEENEEWIQEKLQRPELRRSFVRVVPGLVATSELLSDAIKPLT